VPRQPTAPDRHGGARARQEILASRERFWTPADLQLTDSTAHHLLGDLTTRGELRRVRRGLYWRGVTTPLGMTPPSNEQLLTRLAPGPGVGPAGLSAANHLRLSTQVPRRAHVAVPERAPSDVATLTFVSRPARTARITARLTPTEVALLEVLDAWDRVVELPGGQAAAHLTRLLRDDDTLAAQLTAAAPTEPGRTRARLAALLDASGHPALAAQVPPPDPRTGSAALASLRDAV